MSPSQALHLLIVDDEPLIRQSLYELLRRRFSVDTAATSAEALDKLRQRTPQIVLVDLKLPDGSGLELLRHIKENWPQTDVVVITGYGTIQTAVEAMKKGAFDYITKPINDTEIETILEHIVERRSLLAENENLRERMAALCPERLGLMIGSSPAMQKIYALIRAVASSSATILITGESGTGKGVVARTIHQLDETRRSKPFVEVSCGALSETLLESELFGHVKGAFTGAVRDKVGRFEYASDGTIFLDEIDAFSPALQVKLLKVLQDGTFERVGDNETRKSRARVIVATNRCLKDLVVRGEFREDLYYRVNVITIQVPPLRERQEDLEPLMEHFLERFNRKYNKTIKGFDDEVIRAFHAYDWPGNVRELENAVEGAVVICSSEVISLNDIPDRDRFPPRGAAHRHAGREEAAVPASARLKHALLEPEKQLIIETLVKHNGNRSKAAAELGINRTTLYNKMKKYGLLERRRHET